MRPVSAHGRRPTQLQRWARQLSRRSDRGSDHGMTLVELMIASGLLIVVLTLVLITFNLLIHVTNTVTAQYQEYDQALPSLAPLQTLLRAEVEPAPSPYVLPASGGTNTTAPTPAFSSVGNFALTFYSNTGNPNGPVKVVAEETDTSGNPNPTACNVTTFCEFQVWEYQPTAATCPGVSTGTACAYSATGKLLTDVLHVVNDPSVANGADAIFSYSVFDPWSNTELTPTSTQVAGTYFSTCTAAGTGSTVIATCPADVIQSVSVFLKVSAKGAGTNGTVQNQTIVYRYPEDNGTSIYPFQYTAAVG